MGMVHRNRVQLLDSTGAPMDERILNSVDTAIVTQGHDYRITTEFKGCTGCEGQHPDWDLPTDAEIAEANTLDDDERCTGRTATDKPCELRANHIGDDHVSFANGGIADGEPLIPGDYTVGDTVSGTIPGALWVWPQWRGAVRRNPARPVPTRLGSRAVAVSVTKHRLDILGRSLDRLINR